MWKGGSEPQLLTPDPAANRASRENSIWLQNIIKIKVFGTLVSKTLSNYIETHNLGRGDSPTLVFYNENATFTLPDRPPALSLQPLGPAGLFLGRSQRGRRSSRTHQHRTAVRNGLEHVAEDRRERWDELVAEAITGPPGLFNPNGGVVTAFQAALSAIVNTAVPVEQPSDHLRDALVATVRIGHDTDTVAALAGALLGARWGTGSIPDEWLNLVHGDRRGDRDWGCRRSRSPGSGSCRTAAGR